MGENKNILTEEKRFFRLYMYFEVFDSIGLWIQRSYVLTSNNYNSSYEVQKYVYVVCIRVCVATRHGRV